MKKAFLPIPLLLSVIVLLFIPDCRKSEPAKLPVISTTVVSNITGTTATSGGDLASDGGAKILAVGVCWGITANPSTTDFKTTDAVGAAQFVSAINNLIPGTTYHIRAYATNVVGTGYGADMSFTTLGQEATCITQPATNINASGATLNGTIYANYLSTTVTFEYGTSTSYGTIVTASESPVTGNTVTNINVDISGLTAGITYHYRVKTMNSMGTVYGDDLTFTTVGSAPSVLTQAATNLSTSGATLNGAVNANYASTTVIFEYGTTTSYGSQAAADQTPVTGNTLTNVNVYVIGLAGGTIYHFRVKAVSLIGTSYGSDLSFVTSGQAPSAITQDATNITGAGATLNGTVNPNQLSTTVTFDYGTSVSYGSTTAAIQSPLTGNTLTNVNANLSGMTAGTIYHFRVKTVNSLGTIYGRDLTFMTLNVPTISTTAITSITSNSATSGGTISSDGGAGVTARGVCWGTAANPTMDLTTKTIDGSGTGSFPSSITGLVAGSTYHVRAYATNSAGTAYGSDVQFTTSGSAPTVVTLSASAITSSAATLNGSVNPNYLSTTVTFEYGLTTSYGSTVTGSQSPVTGSSVTSVTAGIAGLTAGSTYHFRVRTVNSAGTVYGNDLSFITPGSSPSSVTTAAGNITSSAATLNGTVNPNYLSTIVTFEYGLTTGYGSTATATQSPVTGNSITNVSATISGLPAGTIYHFRVKAVNSLGTTYGNDLSFTTSGSAPTVVTLAATSITSSTTTLNGTVNPNYLSTIVTFEYGLTTSYGSTVTASQSPATGSSVTNVSSALTGLSVGTIYHFRVIAVNSAGTAYGSDLTVTTITVPTISTTAITTITDNSATSGGSISSDGGSGITARGVCWSTSANPTMDLTTKTIDGSGTGSFPSSITGLVAGSTYHVRAYATNFAGTAYGSDVQFTTSGSAPTVVTLAASAITSSGATLNGSVNPNYLSTTVTFEYGLTTSYGSTVTASQSPVTGSSVTGVNVSISGLSDGITYHCRVKAVNSLGTTYGSDFTLTTSGIAPVSITAAATNIATTGVTLNGTVNANNSSATVTFEYGTTTSYGTTVTAAQSPVSGSSVSNVSAALTGLSVGTIYHFRVMAVNSVGTAYGSDLTFTTLNVPTMSTTAITSITTTSASSGGSISSDGGSGVTARGVCWGTAANPTMDLTTKTIDGSGTGSFPSNITGLVAGSTYHVRAYATNSAGTAYGSDVQFTTSGSAPTVVTLAASAITSSAATLNGSVNPNYLSTTVTFEYGLTTSYGSTVTASQSPVTGSSVTSVNAALTGLSVGTTYHFRGKGVNSLGTTFGSDLTFTTINVLTITTTAISEITDISATSGGNITSDGGFSVTARGVCWGTAWYPTISGSKTNDGTGIGVFTSSITGLNSNNDYHVRAYATNSAGTVYGNDVYFSPAAGRGPIIYNPNIVYGLVEDIDGNNTPTVTIGSQTWMARNLMVQRYNDGTIIPFIRDYTEWANTTTGAFGVWGNDDFNYSTYGLLYNGYAVNTGKLCPTGWHVPNDAEWTTLTGYLGGMSPNGGRLKETGITHWNTPNSGATNETGFTALPGGLRYGTGTSWDAQIGSYGYWWSSTSSYSSNSYWEVFYEYDSVFRLGSNFNDGYSVRCLKDN